MSKEAVETIIGKAVVDSAFREALFANPDGALAGYDLSEAEAAALKTLDSENVESLASSLDERISKAYYIGDHGAGFGKKAIRRIPRRLHIPREP